MHLPGHNSALDVARATLQAVEKLSTLVPAFEDELNQLISMTQSIITTVGVSNIPPLLSVHLCDRNLCYKLGTPSKPFLK